ncbi:MAG: hypothetical protein HWN65_00105 [Candidatus Helarchaeota archaeon]|nr:hypothetical protein [Candidatus Helarchaeota archaeon]
MSGVKEPAEDIPSIVHVTSYPKIIFLWPTWVVSWAFWILSMIMGEANFLALDWLPWVWIIILTFNLFVVSFEFAAGKFLAILILIFVFVGLVLTNVIPLYIVPPNLPIPPLLYLVISMIFTIIYLLLWVSRRFNYLEITHQQVSYHVGILADERRYPAPGCHFEKKTEDVFERIMPPFCAKLIMKTETGEVSEIMDCVPRINRRLSDIKKILDYIQVRQS